MAENITGQNVFSLCQEKGCLELWHRLCVAAVSLYHSNAQRGHLLSSGYIIPVEMEKENSKLGEIFEECRRELQQVLGISLEHLGPTCVYTTCRDVS